jgi:hypothetical protein
MAKKIVTEVLEIEAGAVLKALRADGWPTFGTVHALDKDGKAIEGFSGLRFIYETEEVVRQAPVAK